MTNPEIAEWNVSRDVAVPRLLREHGGRLLALARRLCAGPDEAEDLVQEVFLQAWRKWDQFEGRAEPVVWLYTIARHGCERMHRKRSGEPAHVDSLDELLPFGTTLAAVVPDKGSVAREEQRDRQETVGNAISALPAEFRMALVLRDVIGFSVDEVAQILGVPAATVRTRVHRARLKARQALAAGLPQRELPPPAYSRQVCLDLLQAKQEALDRGAPMPNADEIICERCSAVFDTLDLTQDVCRSLGDQAVLPERLAKILRAAMEG